MKVKDFLFRDVLEVTLGHSEVKWQLLGLSREGSDWVSFNLSIKNRWFNYSMTAAEFIDYGGLLNLAEGFKNLLNGKLDKIETLGFLEPDLHFILYPKNFFSSDWMHDSLFMKEDICVQMIIKHWDNGITYSDEEYRFPIYREEIQQFIAYFDKIIPNITAQWNEQEPLRREND